MTIRLLEEEKLMKTYRSFLEDTDLATRPEILAIIDEADRCSSRLRSEAPALVESYRKWCEDPNSLKAVE